MRGFDRWIRRARLILRRREVREEIDEEIRLHLEMEAEDLVRTRGLSPEEARRRARLSFGGVERYREEGRDARGTAALESGVRELRFLTRALRRNPGYAFTAVVTLGIGLGAVSAIFMVVDAVVLRPLPYPEANRLVMVHHRVPAQRLEQAGLRPGTYLHYRASVRSFEGIGSYRETSANLSDGIGEVQRVRVAHADPELFDVLRTRPALGRAFTEEDWSPVIVRRGTAIAMDVSRQIPILLSHGFWSRRYGGDPSVLGRVVMLDGSPREVVGIMPEGFAFPSAGTEIWVIFVQGAFGAATLDPGPGELGAVARLASGVTPAAAETELGSLLSASDGGAVAAQQAPEGPITPVVVPLRSALIRDVATPLWILFAGMGFLLVVATANVVNLFLIRLEHRAREVSVRSALGARRSELVRLILGEALVICSVAGVMGILIAAWTSSFVPRVPFEMPRLDDIRMDVRVVAFTVVAALLVAAVLGALGSWRFARPGLAPTRLGSRRLASSRDGRRIREALIAAQVALTLALLVGGALMARTFQNLSSVDRGFSADRLLTVEIAVPQTRWREVERIHADLLERIRALPGVGSAAAARSVPLTGPGGWASGVRREGGSDRVDAVDHVARMLHFSPGYFQVMRSPVLEGSPVDTPQPLGVENPVVVSAALARRLFPGESSVGRPIHWLEIDGSVSNVREPMTIVGVVADVREETLRGRPAELVYVPLLDPPVQTGIAPLSMTLVIRTELSPMMIAPSVGAAIRDFDRDITIGGARTMDSIVAASMARESLLGTLLLIAGALCLLLGAIGVYGVVAYAVRRRTAEIGIRIALGAPSGQVTALMLLESLGVVIVGSVIGLAAALTGARALRSLLFGVTANDPLILAAATAVVVLVAMAAALVPAKRAASLDPVTALRAD